MNVNKSKFLIVLNVLVFRISTKIQARLHFPQYCTYYNYPTETHTFSTLDGYNLKFFRLQAKGSEIKPRDKVVYLQHGLQDSSDTWIVNKEENAPGFILANKGYDVWVGNTRGNRYSSPDLNPNIRDFWNFTFDEMISYDLPAAFTYIAKATGKKVHYIGHSQGNLIMLAALSQHLSEIQNNLASYSAFAPVAYLVHQESLPIKKLVQIGFTKKLIASGMKQIFFSKNQGMQELTAWICGVDQSLCRLVLFEIGDKNNTVNNVDRMNVIMGHFPSGSSVKNMDHFSQFVAKEKFCKYDYGEKGNMKAYGQKEPPVYDLGQITFPLNLFIGTYDRLGDIEDNKKVIEQLKNCQKTVTTLDYGHASFIWGKSNKHVESAIQIIESS